MRSPDWVILDDLEKNLLMQRLVLAPKWLQILIVVLLVLGIFFRFVNLGGKVYSQAEIDASLRIAGYTTTEVKQQIFNGRVISQANLVKYQSLNPQKGMGDTIKSLAIEAPQYPPLYYLVARLWAEFFGNSITALRTLSAMISLLVFPSTYWLCRELFKVPLSLPGIAIALLAISPIHLIYAQEAQPHILWMVTILVSSASLLRALRLESTRQTQSQRIFHWGIYAITLVLSFYTFLLSGFVAVAHGIYVVVTAKYRAKKTTEAYLMATIAAFTVFMPWFLVAISQQLQVKSTSDLVRNFLGFIDLVTSCLTQVSRIFFDLNLNWANPVSLLMTLIFIIIVGYAIFFVWHINHEKISFFIISLIVVTSIFLIFPDIIMAGARTIDKSFLIPGYIGIQLAVAYLFAYQLYNGSFARRQIWQTIFALVISLGLVSCIAYTHAETWWSKFGAYGNFQVAKIVNQASRPLLISNDYGSNFENIVSLSYLVKSQVRFQLVKGNNIPEIPKGFSDVFLVNISENLRKGLAKKYRTQARTVYRDKDYLLWKL